MLRRQLFIVLCAAAAGAQLHCARSKVAGVVPSSPVNAQASANTPKRPGSFDLSSLDRTADPCVDFFQFGCGNWLKNNPIPADQSRWGRFVELYERNREVLHQILEKASAPRSNRSAVEQRYGDFYASCMNEKTINEKGWSPLRPELDRIAALKSKSELITQFARMHHQSFPSRDAGGIRAAFSFGAAPDLHNASRFIAAVDQGGLGLPDRDYYLKNGQKAAQTRSDYLKHVQLMFGLIGESPTQAAQEAKVVMELETDLAKASMDNVARRDPKNRDHKMSLAQLSKIAPALEFNRYFRETGAPPFKELNVGNPDFFKALNRAINRFPLDQWKTYLRWHLLAASAPNLSTPFVDENFNFSAKILRGQKEMQARWKRCVIETDRLLGEALGQAYVDAAFSAEAKERTLKMVGEIEKAMQTDLTQLPWMTDETKQRAFEKLHAIINKIGYPEKWRDYTPVRIVRDDHLGNVWRSMVFERQRRINKIGQPLDKKEWSMSPPTVNAYYNSAENDINFPAGILQPPFFDNAIDDAVNYGGIGAVIGHELTHGFDDQGRKFDAKGNLTDWWTPADGKQFEERASCLADEYSSFVAVKDPPNDLHVNGRLTLGENTADNGGLHLAYMALEDSLAGRAVGPIEGFTPEQRLFLGFSQIWCDHSTEENARLRALTDPHSPGRYRVNGVVQNMPEFAKAFQCKAGQPMVRQPPCRVW